METVPKGLIAAAVLAFLLAVIASLSGATIMNVPGEAFSRASNNLALIAIALLLLDRSRGPERR